ncbi:MAG TPA: substrate-binding domain-containing protein, partial [Planctomycetota bacterium]|nr:substrate-binding domain-containing protein [Planctomycetota bacterium]
MSNLPTVRRPASRCFAVLLGCLLGSCSQDERPLPLPQPREQVTPPPRLLPIRVRVADGALTPAVPATEVQQQRPEAAPQSMALALARDLTDLVGDDCLRAFNAANPGTELRFLPAGEHDAVELARTGKVDGAIVAMPLDPRTLHAGMRQHLLGCELIAVVVPAQVPLQSLARWQAHALLIGELADWSQLGCAARPIVLLLPAEARGAERTARAFLAGAPLTTQATRLVGDQLVLDQLLRTEATIGVLRLAAAAKSADVRVLAIDGVAATADNFRAGSYPF